MSSIPEKTVATVLVKCARHCCICRRFSLLQIQLHHIVEQCHGGTHDEDNLIPICISCHSMVHTKTYMTKGFSIQELKGHRDDVYDMVAKGKLPLQSQITGGEMQTLAAIILETLKAENKDIQLSDKAAELLFAAACEESPIKMQRLGNGFHVSVDRQIFILQSNKKSQYPDSIYELSQKGYVKFDGELVEITEVGISHVQDLIGTTAKFMEKKVKCLKCSLHFTIHSWNPELHRASELHCPECGQAEGAFQVWAQYKFGFIFQQVPGNANLWDW